MCTRRVNIKIKSGYKVHHQLGGFLYPEGNKVGIVGNFRHFHRRWQVMQSLAERRVECYQSILYRVIERDCQL